MKIEGYKTLLMYGYTYVLCSAKDREWSAHDNANFRGTGMALCGIVPPRQSVKAFIDQHAAKDTERAAKMAEWKKNAEKARVSRWAKSQSEQVGEGRNRSGWHISQSEQADI